MAEIDPRISARRRQVAEGRARRRVGRLLVLLAAGGLIAVAFWVVRSPLLALDRLDVNGVARSAVPDLLADAGVIPGTPLVDIDPNAVSETLRGDPWVRSATVVRDWPDRVVVEVEERFPVAWALTGEGWLQVADDGVVVGRGTPGESLPQILAPSVSESSLASDLGFSAALEFVVALRDDLGVRTQVTVLGDNLEASVMGYAVRLGFPEEMTAKAIALAAVLDSSPEAGSEITLIAPSRPAVLEPSQSTTTTEP